MFIPAANLFFFFPRHTVPLHQSLQVQSRKGRTYSNKKNPSAVKHPFCYTQTSLLLTYSPHEVQTPLFFSMHLSGLPFQFRKYFMYGRDETWGFLHVTPWWLGLGWHQRRPAFTSCSAIGFLCKVSLNALHFHMDTTASAGVARWCCNTHSRNRRKCEGGQNCTRMAAVFQQLHGDLSISLWLPQEPKCFDEESRWLTQG